MPVSALQLEELKLLLWGENKSYDDTDWQQTR